MKSTFQAFAAGARSVRPDFAVTTIYVGNWEDVGAAKEAALALARQGCDFLVHNADAAGLGRAVDVAGGTARMAAVKDDGEDDLFVDKPLDQVVNLHVP